MRKIVYYVASSIDGYISGINEDISGFVGEGNGVDKYLTDIENFDTVIMGRKTYEFGYKYGLQPGQPAYSHMTHYIFSNNFKLENPDPKVKINNIHLKEIEDIKQQSGSDIYLCGGGQFAGWLLDNQKIDFLKLKLNPLIIGNGTRIFGNSEMSYKLQLIENEKYDNGLQIIKYQIIY
ncbi:dihydrofolate reductase family protein [soil metagenome]